MMMNRPAEARTSRIVEIILRSIHRSDETPVEESMVFVELCSKGEGSRLRSRADHKLDAIRSGFAAGCEARLCLAVKVLQVWG
jgi:hypothetical protein